MEKILSSLKKRLVIPIVIVASLLTWLLLCHAHYKSYWFDLIQKTLDSTYGLFGLVITDADGENVLWQTNKIYHRKSWQDKVNPKYLNSLDEPYDTITAPAALTPEYEHTSPRSSQAERIGKKKGEVIGRLYYVRADPPSFARDVTNFLTQGFWVMSGAKRGYLFVTLSTISFGLVVLLIIWLRQRGLELKQKEVEHVRRELEIRKKALEHLTSELEAQKTRKQALEKEADQAYRRAVGLKRALEKLRDALLGVSNLELNQSSNEQQITVRPPVHPQGTILEEIEELIPSLSENAQVLKDQAGVLHEYCANLEQRQMEMQRIVDNAFKQASTFNADNSSNYVDMSPR